MKQQAKKNKKAAAPWRSLCGQLAVIFLPLVLFFGSALRAMRHRGAPTPSAALLLFAVFCAAGAASALVWLWLAWRDGWRPGPWVKRWAPVFLLLALALAVRLPQWGNPPADDAASYYEALYEACRNFGLGFSDWFQSFRLMGHTTWGLVSLLAIPEFLFPGSYHNVWLGQTALSLVTVFCVYATLAACPPVGRRGAFWGALVFCCGGMFLGLDSYLQMDFGCAVFFFWMLWAVSARQYLLMLAAALLTITSKELGIALVAGLYLGCFVYEWRHCDADGVGARLGAVLRKPYLGLLTVVGAVAGCALLFYLFGSGLSWGGLGFGQQSGSILGYYGLDLPYAGFKLFQLLTINFVWLLLLLTGGLLLHFRGALRLEGALPCLLCGAAGAAAVYYLCSCLVVTFPLPRYNLPLEMILVFLNVAVYAALPVRRLRTGFCGALALLLLGQSYLSIDPLMKLVYAQVETDGVVALSKVTIPFWGTAEENDYLGSHIIYNAQYGYLLDGVRTILAQEGYDDDTDLVVLGLDGGLYLGAGGKYGWEPALRDFSYVFGPETVPILTTQTDPSSGHSVDRWREEGYLKKRAIFLWAPRRSVTDLPAEERGAAIPDFYTNVTPGQVDCWPYGSMTYFTADYLG